MHLPKTFFHQNEFRLLVCNKVCMTAASYNKQHHYITALQKIVTGITTSSLIQSLVQSLAVFIEASRSPNPPKSAPPPHFH